MEMAPGSPKPCWDYSMPAVSWVICLVPVIAAGWCWVLVHKNRHATGPKLGSLIALTLSTAAAISGACGTVYLVYFTCVASSTPWTALPEYKLDAYVLLLALSSMVAGLIALGRGHSRKICGTVLLTSGWLALFSFLHGLTI